MINDEEYSKIVQNILIPLSDEIINSKNNRLYHLVKLTKEFDNRLLNEINKLINYIQKSIMVTSDIDRHKISSCIAFAIIKYSPFSISKKGYNLENLYFANEILGIYSAISFLECCNSNIKIIFPKTCYTTKDIDSYIKSLCITLYIGRNNKKLKYSILYLANILFLLEEYSKQNITQ